MPDEKKSWIEFNRTPDRVEDVDLGNIENNTEYLKENMVSIANKVGNFQLADYLEIKEVSGQKVLKLSDEWETYLQQFINNAKAPKITSTSISPNLANAGVATAIIVSYTIENAAEIGEIALYRNDAKLQISSSNNKFEVASIAYNNDTTFQIKGISKNNVQFVGELVTLKVASPSYYGYLNHTFSSVNDLDLLTRKSGNLGTVTFTCPDNSYFYFITIKTIIGVTSGGLEVPITLQQTIVKDAITYNVYTLQDGVQDAATYTFNITEQN